MRQSISNGVKLRDQYCRWFEQPPGSLLEQMEREQLSSILPDLFGYHLLQLGCLTSAQLSSASRISHRVVMTADVSAVEAGVGVYGYPWALPVASDSVDVVVLPHTLEFEQDPHQVLRESDRVLIPEGHIVILGISPWSLFGLWRTVLARRGTPPWCGRFLSPVRLKDWLALLGFDTVCLRTYFFRPPMRRENLLKRLQFMESLGARWWPAFAGGYLLVARKRVATLTPIRPRWRPRRRLLSPDLVEPSTRQMVNHGRDSQDIC